MAGQTWVLTGRYLFRVTKWLSNPCIKYEGRGTRISIWISVYVAHRQHQKCLERRRKYIEIRRSLSRYSFFFFTEKGRTERIEKKNRKIKLTQGLPTGWSSCGRRRRRSSPSYSLSFSTFREESILHQWRILLMGSEYV